jgi:integrase
MRNSRGIKKLPDGRLEIRVRGTDPRTGKRKEVRRIYPMMGIRAARDAQTALREELRRGGRRQTRRLTLTVYVQRWLKSRKAANDRQSTMDNRVQVLEDHILPMLGDLFVDTISGQDVRDWLTHSTTKLIPTTTRTYDPETVNGWLRILKVILRDAVGDLGLDRDPTIRVPNLSVDPDEEDGKALSAAELHSFLNTAKVLDVEGEITFANYVLLLTGFLTGMRWSELSALEWRDLDEKRRCVHIRRAQVRQTVAGTKNRKKRTVTVADIVQEALRKHRQRQLKDQVPGLDKGLIFPSRVGTYRYPSSIRVALDKVSERAELDRHVTPHWMRHTFNNLLRQAKVDHIVLRATTGHQTESMTEHYSHVELEEKREAVAKVLAMVGVG